MIFGAFEHFIMHTFFFLFCRSDDWLCAMFFFDVHLILRGKFREKNISKGFKFNFEYLLSAELFVFAQMFHNVKCTWRRFPWRSLNDDRREWDVIILPLPLSPIKLIFDSFLTWIFVNVSDSNCINYDFHWKFISCQKYDNTCFGTIYSLNVVEFMNVIP